MAIAFAATPHKAPAAAGGTTQTSVALRVARQTRQGRRTTMTATVSTPAPAAGAATPSGTVSFSDHGKTIDGCRSQKLDVTFE